MSYCRWSSDNFKCDVYAYESDMGFMIHLASNKIVGEMPPQDYDLLLKKDKESIDLFVANEKIRSAWMKTCERVAIGLRYDGQSFICGSLHEFYDRMINLREIGYRFPDYVLETILDEIDNPGNERP